jgi:hypothetical protein
MASFQIPDQFEMAATHILQSNHLPTHYSFSKTTFLTLIYNTLTTTPSMGTRNYEQDIISILSWFITSQSEKQQAA